MGPNDLRPWPVYSLGPKARVEEGYSLGSVIRVQNGLGAHRPRHVRGLTKRKGKNGIGATWKKSKNISVNREGYAGK